MQMMLGHVEAATVVRGLLLIAGLGVLWAIRQVRPDRQMEAGVVLLAVMFITTIVPASTFDVCGAKATRPEPRGVGPGPRR